jgi:hypothetical protein
VADTTLSAPDTAPHVTDPAWLKAAVTLGVTSVIALFLTYFLAKDLKADLRDLTATAQATKAVVDKHAIDGQVQRSLLYGICRGVNKTDEARELCEVGR